jgi:histidine triad (HIT) family protein
LWKGVGDRVLRPALHQKWARLVLGWVFSRMSFAIPLRRLRETSSLLAFQHPSPAYPVHVLIVPKRAYASLMELSAQDERFLTDLVETVQSLVRELGLESRGYRLVVNGGEYQDVPQLHFHLISEG